MMAKKQKRSTVDKGIKRNYHIFSLAIILIFLVCFFLPSVSYSGKIRSRSAIVVDALTGRTLYSKNPDLRLPAASTVKLMTAILAIENADFSDIVKVSKRASRVSPSKAGLKNGDMVTIKTLLYAALVKSGNDAAVALAEAVAGTEKRFVGLMNSKAIAIGALNTKFKNPHGLPARGQYTTASDLSKIMNYALMYPELREIIGTRAVKVLTENGHALFLKNTNKLLWSDDDLIGGKTGYTRRARHCFVCAAEREERKIIVVVLGSPNRKTLWKESERLIHKGFEVMINGKDSVIYSDKHNDNSSEIERVSDKKGKVNWAQTSKASNRRKIIAKKVARDKKPKINRENIKTVAKGRDKREKLHRIAEKRQINTKG